MHPYYQNLNVCISYESLDHPHLSSLKRMYKTLMFPSKKNVVCSNDIYKVNEWR